MLSPSFDPDQLLAALPRRSVCILPAETRIPKRRPVVAVKTEYNGFSPDERNRTFDIAKWLVKLDAMSAPHTCSICGGEARHHHAENYYDLTTWIDMCVNCHVTRLHGRFRAPDAWRDHLDRHAIPASHWGRLLSPSHFDLAGLLRQRGAVEPAFQTFLLKSPRG